MDFTQREFLRLEISRIQSRRENRARRMWIRSPISNERIYLGGDARPIKEQNRQGYPVAKI